MSLAKGASSVRRVAFSVVAFSVATASMVAGCSSEEEPAPTQDAETPSQRPA